MGKVNENLMKLQKNYLFSEISRRVKEFESQNPGMPILRLGIGDVTLPLSPAVTSAMQKAAKGMRTKSGFHGYPEYEGNLSLREAIAKNDYQDRGINITATDIFVSDGAKSDCTNLQELFDSKAKIALTDPVYPVYLDSNVLAGRAGEFDGQKWSKVVYMPLTKENHFMPSPPKQKADIVYLCSPNNPTGTAITRENLEKFVKYAQKNNSVLLFDSAYEAYVQDEKVPRSIYEIEGAKKVSVEIRSFSKTAGFTGVRCSYSVIPDEVTLEFNGEKIPLKQLWLRRQATKYNGVSYIVQCGAEAIYSEKGKKQIQKNIDYYMKNAQIIRKGLQKASFEVYGGENSPYIWLKTPNGFSSWEFFNELLREAYIAGTPGSGFGYSGEGYFRLTAFASRENTREAVRRIMEWKIRSKEKFYRF